MSFNWELAKAFECKKYTTKNKGMAASDVDVRVSYYPSTKQFSVSISASAWKRLCGGLGNYKNVTALTTRSGKQLYLIPDNKGFVVEKSKNKNGRCRFRLYDRDIDNLYGFVGDHRLHFNDQLEGHYIKGEEETF